MNQLINESINDEAVYKTAPATPGLFQKLCHSLKTQNMMQLKNPNCEGKKTQNLDYDKT